MGVPLGNISLSVYVSFYANVHLSLLPLIVALRLFLDMEYRSQNVNLTFYFN